MKARLTVSTCEEMRTCMYCWWECKCYCGSSMEVPQKIKNRTTIWPSNPSSGYLYKRIEDINICTLMFTEALFTVLKRWKQPK